MINTIKLKQRRKELGLSQAEVGELTKKKYGVGSQQGYRKLESGEAKNSRFLAYYCKTLQIDPTLIDEHLRKNQDKSAEELFSIIKTLPTAQQIEIAQKILAKLHEP